MRHSDDENVIALWLHGRSTHTQDAYRRDVADFLAAVGKPLAQVTLSDLQAFADRLARAGLAPSTQHRRLSAVRSLLSFAHRIGYLTYDVGRPLRLPRLKNALAARILSEPDTQRMLALEDNPRNHALLLLLYGAGLRVAEVCALRWRDVQPRAEGTGQITVFGKGGKTRAILLPATAWRALEALRGDATDDAPVFVGRKGALTPRQVQRIVRRAATRAGVARNVSPHWLRHAHASHALERGATVALVAQTLGHSSIATTGRYLHARPRESSGRYLAL